MKRLLPSSLLGQVMLVLALGLLVAQAVSATLLYRAAEERRQSALVNTIAFRIVAEQGRTERAAERRARREAMRREQGGEARRPRRGLPDLGGPGRIRTERGPTTPIARSEERLYSYETALRQLLDRQGIAVGEIAITRREAGRDPFIVERVAERPRLRAPGWENRKVIVASIRRADESGWMTFRIPEPERRGAALGTIIFQTVLIYGVLVLLLFLVLRRITRPLAQLTDRLSDFSRRPDRAISLKESGPTDTRRLIAAHNAMEARIAALLDEKDVMLGAIGHDLKTPLAALRVRIESVPDDIQREKMAESIEDITATLDDILTLARVGRSNNDAETVDLAALAIGVVEEFEDLGKPVSLGETERLTAEVQVTWLKRALRNLVGNAVRYGGAAQVSIGRLDANAVLRVEDEGPGIPPDRIEEMLEPFTRGEGSRNRATGGAGLGLTLARAIAEQHGGELVLENRAEGGLRAELLIPL